MSEQLLPCPFCGEAPTRDLDDCPGQIGCETTDCAIVVVERGHVSEAVRVWNRRAGLTALKLAAWRAGVEAAAKACADYERAAVVEDRDESGAVCAVYPTESSVAASEVLANIRALPDPTPEEMERIK